MRWNDSSMEIFTLKIWVLNGKRYVQYMSSKPDLRPQQGQKYRKKFSVGSWRCLEKLGLAKCAHKQAFGTSW
jgi:hypothetical protein